jgi:hypothetical protein
MANSTSVPTSVPTMDATDAILDASVTWTLMVATCLGVLWAYAPRKLRCCTADQSEEQVPDLEKNSQDLQNSQNSVPAAPVNSVPAAPVDTANASGQSRLYFMDNIRLFLVLMVVNTQASRVFMGGDEPFQVESRPSYFLTCMGALANLNSAYVYALFFLLSGYFAPSCLDCQGLRTFLTYRMKRLGLPAIVWFFFLGPLMDFLLHRVFGLASDYRYNPIMGRGWFVVWLLGFSVVYSLLAQRIRCPSFLQLPGAGGLIGCGILLGLLQSFFSIYFTSQDLVFGLAPWLQQTPIYVVFFAAGIAAKRNGWLAERARFKCYSLRESLWAVRIVSVIFAALVILSKDWNAEIFFALWHAHSLNAPQSDLDVEKAYKHNILLVLSVRIVVQSVFAVTVSVVIIDFFRRCFNCGGGSLHRFITDSMYGVFLFHYPFVHMFSWTYIHLIVEQGLGKELAFKHDTWCSMHLECPKEVSILQVTITTPIEELHLWLGWAFTMVLTLSAVFPLVYALRRLPVLRDFL